MVVEVVGVSARDENRGGVNQTVVEIVFPTPEGVNHTDLHELLLWWFATSGADALKTIPKSIEYGSADLIEMGHDLMDIASREVDDAEAAEIGIWFYMLGKIKRWHHAIKRGERVSDDTLLDIAVYAMMARRVREVGGWPGVVM